jgi:hypothetical protein
MTIEPYSRHAYLVESCGFMTGVTGAEVLFGLEPYADEYALSITTWNAFIGENDLDFDASDEFHANGVYTAGNNNEVYITIHPQREKIKSH